MLTEFSFGFEELTLDYDLIIKSLGYEGHSLEQVPEPFTTYLQAAVEESRRLDDMKGAFIIVEVNLKNSKNTVFVNGVDLNVGRVINKELAGATKLAVFVCTAGAQLSNRIKWLLQNDDPVLAYVYDLLGNAIAEAIGDKVQELIATKVSSEGFKITNRYSPGYCHWNVADQYKLFRLMGNNSCGVSLNTSSLMSPVKSISGIIGIGKIVNYRDYQCELCNMKNCYYSHG